MRYDDVTGTQLTIVFVHPSRLFTEGLASLLKDTPYNIVHHLSGVDSACFSEGQLEGKVVFVVGGRDASEIAEAVRSIRSQITSAYILVIHASTEPGDVMIALDAGANGYLRDAISSQTFVRVIELIVEDETILPPEFVKSLREPRQSVNGATLNGDPDLSDTNDAAAATDHYAKVRLSAREGSILEGLVDGAPNKVIAQRLQITEATVKVHVKAILRKIRVKNRTQAAIWASRNLPGKEHGKHVRAELR